MLMGILDTGYRVHRAAQLLPSLHPRYWIWCSQRILDVLVADTLVYSIRGYAEYHIAGHPVHLGVQGEHMLSGDVGVHTGSLHLMVWVH